MRRGHSVFTTWTGEDMQPGRKYEVGDFVRTPVGTGLVTAVEGTDVTVSLTEAGNYYGNLWDLTLIKAVG